MRKHFLKILFSAMFFFAPLVVKANFGDVRYEITDINMSGSEITFKGWAFIHKTNNYTTVSYDGTTVKSDGDQKILMRAIDSSGNVIKNIDGNEEIKVATGGSGVNYNFYCELFYNLYECSADYYKDVEFNKCTNDDNSYCYYEDMYFEIEFDTSKWTGISETENIKFQIAVSNSHYESKIGSSGYYYDGDIFTNPIDLSIGHSAYAGNKYENDYIKIESSSFDDQVDFFASDGLLYPVDAPSGKCGVDGNNYNRFCYRDINNDGVVDDSSAMECAYGEWDRTGGGSNRYSLDFGVGFKGRGNQQSCPSFLGSDCKGTHLYALVVSKKKGEQLACNIAPVCSGTDCATAMARGSHIKRSGVTTFKVTLKNKKLCPVVTEPVKNGAVCNGNGNLSSTCEELTVDTGIERKNVKIEQTGTISSVMTPGRIYNGGGFNFGIMYQNNIKWSYADGVDHSGEDFHTRVNRKMNDKLKNYDSYIEGIKLSTLTLGNAEGNTDILSNPGMIRECYTSVSNVNTKDYYGNNGLTVTCIFTFPSSTIGYDGKVTYNSSSSIGINNKYYTSLDMDSYYDLNVTVRGMDRITESAAKSDSEDNGIAWTGTWEASIKGCKIEVYRLMSPSVTPKYNFIYRPIDIKNPFPDRNAGINWYDWYKIQSNQNRLENTYSSGAEYTAIINNSTMTNIKDYNKKHNYLEWNSIDDNGNSSFVNDYIKRGAGS